MSTWTLTWAGRFTRGWTQLYTTGLPPRIGRERRDKIASDLWEQATEAAYQGEGAAITASHIFGRAVLGMPADLSWHAAELRGHNMETTTSRGTVIGFTLVGLMGVAAGFAMLEGLLRDAWIAQRRHRPRAARRDDHRMIGPFISLAGVYTLRRAEAEGRSPTPGRVLVVSGMAGIALMGAMFWWTIIGPAIALRPGGLLGPQDSRLVTARAVALAMRISQGVKQHAPI